MMTSKLVRSTAVVAALALVLVVAVQNAVASAAAARTASELVGDVQRNIRIMVTPLVANNDIDQSKANKGIDVAIMGGDNSWAFADIDGPTIEFAGALPARSASTSRDVDQDGVADRIYSFTTKQLKLTPADTLACLTFESLQKIKFRGCDKVKVLPAKSSQY
jgi:hypothetical protein